MQNQEYNPEYEIADIYQDELIRIITVRREIGTGYKADRVKVYERFKNNGEPTPVEDEYSYLVKTFDPWNDDNFEGNEIIFKVIAKDHELTDPNYGGQYQTFESLGYSETDKLGKMYGLVFIDI